MCTRYVITVQGHIDGSYFNWCQTNGVTHEEGGETLIEVTVRDQAELHGLLAQIRDLSLPLLSLNSYKNV